MELLLKRNEGSGKRCNLFAKLELKPEEQALMKKAKPESVLVWEADDSKNNRRWFFSLFPAAIGALIFAIVASAVIHPVLFIPVGIIALFALRKMLFNQMTGNITVADIITGRTIHCKSLDELLLIENAVREKVINFCKSFEQLYSLGSEQRIDLNRI